MNEVQDIKRILYPIIKRLPWIVLILIVTLVVTWRLTAYKVPVYESSAILRLDDHATGFSDNNLYRDLDIFSETNDILTEVEMVKSEVVLRRALSIMPTNTFYYREGRLRVAEMYGFVPFTLVYDSSNFEFTDHQMGFKVAPDRQSMVIKGDTIDIEFDQWFKVNNSIMKIELNQAYIEKHGVNSTNGSFFIEVKSIDQLLKDFVDGHLFVKEKDKNVGIVTIHFEGEHPQRCADFTNAVAKAYLDDHIDTKTQAADQTSSFLGARIAEAADKLRKAEMNLESFRLNNRILNVKQETETDLRKIAQLDIQMTNLDMKIVVLDSLEAYINQDYHKFLELAPSFESYGGLLFTELVKKLKGLESDKIDLLNKFTESSVEVASINEKIDNLITYITENIRNHRKNTLYQKEKIALEVSLEERSLDDLPTIEKNLIRLEREFQHYQELFNFLKRKELEAGIAKNAKLNFHRVIKEAKAASKPTSPNKPFNVALAGFLCVLLSVAGSFILDAIKGKVTSRHQIEQLTKAPVLGVVKRDAHLYNDGSIDFVLSNLTSLINKKKTITLSFNSSVSDEGKSYLAEYATCSLASSGRKVLLLNLNSRKQSKGNFNHENKACLQTFFRGQNSKDEVIESASVTNVSIATLKMTEGVHQLCLLPDFQQKMEELIAGFDVVIIDNPAYSIAPEAVVFAGVSDVKLFVVRQDFTHVKFLKNINELFGQYGEDFGVIINDAPRGMNYSGKYFGSRFHYTKPSGIVERVKYFFKSYGDSWKV